MPRRTVNGDSGWYISNALVAPEIMFDTKNVVVTTTATGLSVSGDLVIAPEFSSFIFGGLDTGLDVGSFSLSTSRCLSPPRCSCSGRGSLAQALATRRRARGSDSEAAVVTVSASQNELDAIDLRP